MDIKDMLLTPNSHSRSTKKLDSVKGIVVHWTGNPESTAIANRNYFESLKNGGADGTSASAHFVIGLDGEIIRCLPEDEVGYHVGSSLPYKSGSTQIYTPEAWNRLNTGKSTIKPYPNNCTIGIECCILDAKGTMTTDTYNSLIDLCKYLIGKYKLTANDLWLHKEVVGWKDCHKWFVDNPSEWSKFKVKVGTIAQNDGKVEAVKVEQWKLDTLKKLATKKQANGQPFVDYDTWKDKLNDNTQVWLVFELMKRILEKVEK